MHAWAANVCDGLVIIAALQHELPICHFSVVPALNRSGLGHFTQGSMTSPDTTINSIHARMAQYTSWP